MLVLKKCIKCYDEFEPQFFPVGKNSCIACISAQQAIYRAERSAKKRRVCKICQEPKPISEFIGMKMTCITCAPGKLTPVKQSVIRKYNESRMAGFNPTIQMLLSMKHWSHL
jgi:hypothetical protein